MLTFGDLGRGWAVSFVGEEAGDLTGWDLEGLREGDLGDDGMASKAALTSGGIDM
jgi:hypothetical protein